VTAVDDKPIVDVLLATYNGAAHLPALLASVASQSYGGWRLIIRDDGSDDHTPDLIAAFAATQGDRVLVVRDGRANLGVCGNFSALLDHSTASYFMFCDQDDVWLPKKIETLLKRARDTEARSIFRTPVLVHGDMTVVDEELNEIHESFWDYQRLYDPAFPPSKDVFLVQNYIAGCTMLGNSALREMMRPIPEGAHIHDWWAALIAAQFGEIVPVASPLTLYRQHTDSQIGARAWTVTGIAKRFFQDRKGALPRMQALALSAQTQANAFLKKFGDRLDPETSLLFTEYAGLKDKPLLQRKLFLPRKRLRPGGWPLTFVYWWVL
jgi:hypothetical protein